jgi:hypothetical protein
MPRPLHRRHVFLFYRPRAILGLHKQIVLIIQQPILKLVTVMVILPGEPLIFLGHAFHKTRNRDSFKRLADLAQLLKYQRQLLMHWLGKNLLPLHQKLKITLPGIFSVKIFLLNTSSLFRHCYTDPE